MRTHRVVPSYGEQVDETVPGDADGETIASTPRQWIALSVVAVIALLSTVAYPVYDRYTAHSVTMVVTTDAGSLRTVPPPLVIYSRDRDTQGLNRLRAGSSVPILENRIERYMSSIPAGTCSFAWTIRYSENSADLGSSRVLVFADRQCP